MRKSSLARIVGFLAVVGLLAPVVPTAAAPGAPPVSMDAVAISASQYSPDAQECAMLAKINAYRKARGRKPLSLSRTLGAAAEHYSRDMASKNYFSHTLRGGISWSQNITNHGYPTNTYRAENIAAGNSSASATFNQWVNSSGHRANMLSSKYTAIGIGRAYNSKSTYKWYWTTTFGSAKHSTIRC